MLVDGFSNRDFLEFYHTQRGQVREKERLPSCGICKHAHLKLPLPTELLAHALLLFILELLSYSFQNTSFLHFREISFSKEKTCHGLPVSSCHVSKLAQPQPFGKLSFLSSLFSIVEIISKVCKRSGVSPVLRTVTSSACWSC